MFATLQGDLFEYIEGLKKVIKKKKFQKIYFVLFRKFFSPIFFLSLFVIWRVLELKRAKQRGLHPKRKTTTLIWILFLFETVFFFLNLKSQVHKTHRCNQSSTKPKKNSDLYFFFLVVNFFCLYGTLAGENEEVQIPLIPRRHSDESDFEHRSVSFRFELFSIVLDTDDTSHCCWLVY